MAPRSAGRTSNPNKPCYFNTAFEQTNDHHQYHEEELMMKVEESDVAKTLAKIGIYIGSDMEGCQICPGFSRKIFVWLKPSCNIQRFCKDECYKVSEGVKTS